MEGIEIKVLEADERQEELILEPFLHFWACESTCSAIPGLRSEKGRAIIGKILNAKTYTRNAPLLVAWDKHKSKAAGFLWNKVQKRNDPVEMNTEPRISSGDWDEVTKKQFEGAIEFFGRLKKKSDAFNRLGVEKMWNLLILSVGTEYTGRGIGLQLVERSLQLAKEREFPVAISKFSSKYTQQIGRRCGFEAIAEEPYTKDTYSNFDNMSAETVETHKKCIVMAKKLYN